MFTHFARGIAEGGRRVMYHIYKITNCLNGKIYIGQTRQPIEKRFLQHRNADSPLGQAIRDCGIENFTIEVIEECTTPDTARQQEMFWVKALNCRVPNGYNQSAGGEGTFPRKTKPRSNDFCLSVRKQENFYLSKRPNNSSGLVLNLEDAPLSKQIKIATKYRGYTMKKLGEEYNRQFGTKLIKQSFSRKINKGALSWEELKRLGQVLGFKPKLELVD